jgi:Spy/CpxP family protein refolding chaperone
MAIWTAVAGALAAAPAGVAWAQAAAPNGAPTAPHSHERGGLIRLAEQLDSLRPDQRTTIQQIAATQRAATAPLRRADAAVLTTLAQQVEAGAIDRSALATGVQARESAGLAARAAHQESLQKLHDALTADQRNQLVDALEARMQGPRGAGDGGAAFGRAGRLAAFEQRLGLTPAQEEQIRSNFRAQRAADGASPPDGGGGFRAARAGRFKTWLEAFRADDFHANALSAADMSHVQAVLEHRADRFEDWMQAAVPVLTASQRTSLAEHLRRRAAHESQG